MKTFYSLRLIFQMHLNMLNIHSFIHKQSNILALSTNIFHRMISKRYFSKLFDKRKSNQCIVKNHQRTYTERKDNF